MVYIYKKTIGDKNYYYLRASVEVKEKKLTKDIAYLGNDIKQVEKKLDTLNSHKKEIRKAYKTIKKFIETNIYYEKIKSQKLKKTAFLSKESLENIETCKSHWNNSFSRLNELTKEEILKNFIVEFAFNTTSIEGNTITLNQAKKLLMENLTPKNKSLREIFDLQNTEKTFWKLYFDLKQAINHDLICKIHSSLLENIDNRAGYRREEVRVFKMNFKSTPAKYVKMDMDLLLKWYNKEKKRIHPFALASIFHHKFEKIHPFMDGNGRTGRMLTSLILLQQDCPPLIIRKKSRNEYLNNLNKADKCELDKLDEKYYKALIEFLSNELKETYWNIFL